METETLIHYPPRTDFEKLLFAQKFIESLRKERDELKLKNKELKQEIGVLKSEIDKFEFESSNRMLTQTIKNQLEELRSIKSKYTEKHKVSSIKVALDRIMSSNGGDALTSLGQLNKSLSHKRIGRPMM